LASTELVNLINSVLLSYKLLINESLETPKLLANYLKASKLSNLSKLSDKFSTILEIALFLESNVCCLRPDVGNKACSIKETSP